MIVQKDDNHLEVALHYPLELPYQLDCHLEVALHHPLTLHYPLKFPHHLDCRQLIPAYASQSVSTNFYQFLRTVVASCVYVELVVKTVPFLLLLFTAKDKCVVLTLYQPSLVSP